MSDFTYETRPTTALETYEWDNVWWEQAPDTTSTRVLYIGDSISCGTRRLATEIAGDILFDGYGSSKALDNPYLKDAIRMFAAQQGHREAVVFNNGLHGWHLDDETEYPALLKDTLVFLKETFAGTPVAVVLTTRVVNEERQQRVLVRNKAAVAIAEELGLPVIDYFAVSEEAAALQCADGVHFTEEGNRMLAAHMVNSVRALLP